MALSTTKGSRMAAASDLLESSGGRAIDNARNGDETRDFAALLWGPGSSAPGKARVNRRQRRI